MFLTATALFALWPAKAVKYEAERRGVERSVDREGLHHVGLNGDRMPFLESLRHVAKHGLIGVQERDLRVTGRVRLLDEVAGPRPNVEVPVPHVLSIHVDALCDGNLPDRLRHELQYPHVVDREHRRVVPGLPLVRRIGLVHAGKHRIGARRDDRNASVRIRRRLR